MILTNSLENFPARLVPALHLRSPELLPRGGARVDCPWLPGWCRWFVRLAAQAINVVHTLLASYLVTRRVLGMMGFSAYMHLASGLLICLERFLR